MAAQRARLSPPQQIEVAEPGGATFKPYLLKDIFPISGNLAGFAASNPVP